MGDDITIGVTEIVNNIEVTAQPNDQVIDISVVDNSDEVTLNVTPNVVEVNINKGSSFARWGTIFGNLTDQIDLTNALFNKADLVDGKVPSYQLPSFVDDVIEVANYAALPTVGEIGKIYITLDNNKIYRWSGSIYIEIASNQAIWGAITGTLSNQTDLVNALNLKANDADVVKLTGDQTITGTKSFNSSTSIGIRQNNSGNGYGIYSENASNGFGYYVANNGSGKAISVANALGSFGNMYEGSYNGTNNYSVNYLGEITGSKFTRIGGTSSQFLKADGSIDSSTYLTSLSGAVLTSTDQTISNTKTFLNSQKFEDTLNLKRVSSISLFSGYSGITADVNGFYLSNSNTKYAYLNFSTMSTSRSFTLPDTNGVFTLGSGTTNYLAKWSNGNTVANSQIFDNGTNVGIGTTSPSGKLTVYGGQVEWGDTSSLGFLGYTGGDALVGAIGSRNFALYTNGTERMRITSIGNVGIGTSNPSVKLHVVGSGYMPVIFEGGTNAGAGLYFSGGGTQFAEIFGEYESSNNGQMFFRTRNAGSINTAMTINSSGNVGIGTTSPFTVTNQTSLTLDGVNASRVDMFSGGVRRAGFYADSGICNLGSVTAIPLTFSTSDTERMRIRSGGGVYINRASDLGAGYGLVLGSDNNQLQTMAMFIAVNGNNNINFFNASGTYVASISTNASSVSYGTGSDYRLKEDLKDFNGLDKISKIKVYDFKFIKEGDRMEGVLAHELQEIVPYAVNGEKDGIDENGNIKIQNVDYSKLTPILIKAIQELKAEIELLKQK